jgi:hypothetical protein
MKSAKNDELISKLRQIADSDSPAYAAKAHQMLSEISSLDAVDVFAFIDAYLNDPYLTKS